MELTREMVQQRLDALRRDWKALSDRRTAVEGAIADCEFWLREVEKAAPVNSDTSSVDGGGELNHGEAMKNSEKGMADA